jgi:hypothetical protein
MNINYGEKGKIFTNLVVKKAMDARIQTTSHLIEGEIYVRPDYRLKDELDIDEPFLAVTNACVFNVNKEVLFRTKFIAIRRDQVVWITTMEEIEREGIS